MLGNQPAQRSHPVARTVSPGLARDRAKGGLSNRSGFVSASPPKLKTASPRFPTTAELMQPKAVERLVAYSKQLRQSAVASNNASRYIELAQCAHAALHLFQHPKSRTAFDAINALKKEEITLREIYRQVLLEYVGQVEGRAKKASFWLRATYPTLEKVRSAATLYDAIKKTKVSGLLKQGDNDKGDHVTVSKRPNSSLGPIKLPGRYQAAVPKGKVLPMKLRMSRDVLVFLTIKYAASPVKSLSGFKPVRPKKA